MSKIIDRSYFTNHEDQSLKPQPTIAVHMPYHAHISVDIKDDWIVARNGHQGWEAVKTFSTLGEAKKYLDYCNSPDVPFDHACWKSTDISWVQIDKPKLTVSHQSVVQEPEIVSEEKMREIKEHCESVSKDLEAHGKRLEDVTKRINRLKDLSTRLEAQAEEMRQMILDPESGQYFHDFHTYKEGE